jgi:hypothetical protein
VPSVVQAKEYTDKGGKLLIADAPNRTHPDDTDPIVATFQNFVTEEEAQEIIGIAEPLMRRAGVSTQGTHTARRAVAVQLYVAAPQGGAPTHVSNPWPGLATARVLQCESIYIYTRVYIYS